MKTIALLTDFGMRDYYVGALKGAVLSINSEAVIVDITHQIPPQDIAAGSFTLRACYRNFPAGTIFVAVVDPGVGSDRRPILVETEDYFFVGPDNGLFSFVFDETKSFRVYELTNRAFFATRVSRTFHGRDIFAPVAAHLSRQVEPHRFGTEIKDFVRHSESRPRQISAAIIEAEVIHIDCFGNLVTNLRAEELPKNFSVEIGDRVITKHCQFYAQAKPGEIFTIEGSAGFLEVSACNDSAQKLLAVETRAPVRLMIGS